VLEGLPSDILRVGRVCEKLHTGILRVRRSLWPSFTVSICETECGGNRGAGIVILLQSKPS
jgi:hypothetical protein